jgi:hypothetical protein
VFVCVCVCVGVWMGGLVYLCVSVNVFNFILQNIFLFDQYIFSNVHSTTSCAAR